MRSVVTELASPGGDAEKTRMAIATELTSAKADVIVTADSFVRGDIRVVAASPKGMLVL